MLGHKTGESPLQAATRMALRISESMVRELDETCLLDQETRMALTVQLASGILAGNHMKTRGE